MRYINIQSLKKVRTFLRCVHDGKDFTEMAAEICDPVGVVFCVNWNFCMDLCG